MAKQSVARSWWRQLLFDVPRMRTHAASRKRVLSILVATLVVVIIFAIFFGAVGAFEYKSAGWWGIGFVCLMYALSFSLRSRMKRAGETVTLSISTAAPPSLRRLLLDYRCVVATLVNRAAFEVMLSQGHPAESPGLIRAQQLERLRSRKLWEKIPRALHDLLASPEGSWTVEVARKCALQAEAVAVLNWALCEATQLPALQHCSKFNAQVLADALKDETDEPAFVRPRTKCEGELAPTSAYVMRITDELITRDALKGEAGEISAEEYEASVAYGAHLGDFEIFAEDLPIGGQLVREAKTDELFYLRGVAAVRYTELHALIAAGERPDLEAWLMPLVEAIQAKASA